MSFQALLPLLLVHWTAMISPGPNVLLVTQTAVSRSRFHALAAGAGIASGAFLWCLATLTGLAVLFASFPWMQWGLRIMGGRYLCYLGARLFWNAAQTLVPMKLENAFSYPRCYAQGLGTTLINPKSAVYFAAILPSFLPHRSSLGSAAFVLALLSVSSLLWYGLLAVGFSHRSICDFYLRIKKGIDRSCGLLLGGFGITLLLIR
ncbi:MAG TPA: LysE family translocator [Dongiaceae bacterium]|jgi:threonine efflux protein|nr:LysE family translocator [Dongiaceae bacterium]